MSFGKLLLASVLGRLITAGIGIVVLIVIVLIVGAAGNKDNTGLDKGSVNIPSYTATSEPSPSGTFSNDFTPEGYPWESKTTFMGKARSEGLFAVLDDDQMWNKAVKVCADFDAGAPGRHNWEDTDADLQEMSFEQYAIDYLCPQHKGKVDPA